jgi:hypothetical protein
MAPPNLKFVKASGPIDIVDKSNWFLFIFLLEPRLCLGCEFCNYFAMPFDLNKFYFCWFRRCTFQLRLNSFLLYPFVFEIWLSCFSEMHSLNWGWIFFWTPICHDHLDLSFCYLVLWEALLQLNYILPCYWAGHSFQTLFHWGWTLFAMAVLCFWKLFSHFCYNFWNRFEVLWTVKFFCYVNQRRENHKGKSNL